MISYTKIEATFPSREGSFYLLCPLIGGKLKLLSSFVPDKDSRMIIEIPRFHHFHLFDTNVSLVVDCPELICKIKYDQKSLELLMMKGLITKRGLRVIKHIKKYISNNLGKYADINKFETQFVYYLSQYNMKVEQISYKK